MSNLFFSVTESRLVDSSAKGMHNYIHQSKETCIKKGWHFFTERVGGFATAFFIVIISPFEALKSAGIFLCRLVIGVVRCNAGALLQACKESGKDFLIHFVRPLIFTAVAFFSMILPEKLWDFIHKVMGDQREARHEDPLKEFALGMRTKKEEMGRSLSDAVVYKLLQEKNESLTEGIGLILRAIDDYIRGDISLEQMKAVGQEISLDTTLLEDVTKEQRGRDVRANLEAMALWKRLLVFFKEMQQSINDSSQFTWFEKYLSICETMIGAENEEEIFKRNMIEKCILIFLQKKEPTHPLYSRCQEVHEKCVRAHETKWASLYQEIVTYMRKLDALEQTVLNLPTDTLWTQEQMTELQTRENALNEEVNRIATCCRNEKELPGFDFYMQTHLGSDFYLRDTCILKEAGLTAPQENRHLGFLNADQRYSNDVLQIESILHVRYLEVSRMRLCLHCFINPCEGEDKAGSILHYLRHIIEETIIHFLNDIDDRGLYKPYDMEFYYPKLQELLKKELGQVQHMLVESPDEEHQKEVEELLRWLNINDRRLALLRKQHNDSSKAALSDQLMIAFSGVFFGETVLRGEFEEGKLSLREVISALEGLKAKVSFERALLAKWQTGLPPGETLLLEHREHAAYSRQAGDWAGVLDRKEEELTLLINFFAHPADQNELFNTYIRMYSGAQSLESPLFLQGHIQNIHWMKRVNQSLVIPSEIKAKVSESSYDELFDVQTSIVAMQVFYEELDRIRNSPHKFTQKEIERRLESVEFSLARDFKEDHTRMQRNAVFSSDCVGYYWRSPLKDAVRPRITEHSALWPSVLAVMQERVQEVKRRLGIST